MASKDIYGTKETKKQLYGSSGTANVRKQSTSQSSVWSAEQNEAPVQSDTIRKNRREKSPSERGEEAIRTMLKEDALKEQQKQAVAGSTAQYNSGGTATVQYSSPPTAEPAIQKREKSPSELGKEVVRAMLEDDGLLEPEKNETPATRAFAAGVGRSDIIGPDANAARNITPGDGRSVAVQSNGADAGPTQAMSDWLTLMSASDPDHPGLATFANQMGMELKDKANQIAEDSYLAPGMSPIAFVGENILSGGWGTLENGWNGFVDYTLPFANAALDQQMGENEQLALMFGGDFRRYVDSQNALLQEVRDGMPEAVETLRRHDAAAYQQSIIDRYDPHGAYIPIGEISSGVGQGITQIGLGAIDPSAALAQQFFSASGSMAQEAREAGASDELALLSGAFSGGKELLNNKFFGGIPFLGDSFADDLAMKLASTNEGRAILKGIFNIGGEGLEEGIGTYEDAFISKLWNGDDRGTWQTIKETTPDAVHAGLISMGTSSLLTPFSFVPEYQDARIVDEALDIMNNGGMLTDTQLAGATAAMHRLTGDGHNSWNGVPFDEWTDTVNKHLDGQLSPAANSGGNAVDLSGIDTSNIIFFPTGDELRELAKANADANAASSSALNNAITAQNGQRDLSNVFFFPTRDQLETWAKKDADANAASSPAADNTATTQNSPQDLSNVIFFPTGDELRALAKANADFNAASSSALNNATTAQNGQRDLSNVFFFPTRDQLETWAKKDADANTASPQAANNAAAAQNGQTNASETVSQTGLAQNANDVSTEYTADKTAGEPSLQTDPVTDTVSPEMIAAQNAKTREQALEEGKAKEGRQAEMSPEIKNAPESTGKTGETSFPTEEMSVEKKKDVANAAAQGYNENKVGRRVEIIDGVKHYYDDNGNLYRVKNDLQPNCEYELNGYKYQTDDIRRIRFAEGILHLKERKGRLPIRDSIEDIGKGDQKKGDNRGHLIGDQFDGPNGLENIVPQDAEVNQKDFRNFENKLAAEVKNGKEVYVKVEPVYEGNSRRPSSIEVTYRINGVESVRLFLNGKE